MTAETRKRQVLFLMGNLGGGTGTHLLEIVRYLQETSWEGRLLSSVELTARGTLTAPINFLKPFPFFDHYPFGQIYGVQQVSRFLKQHPADLVHAYFFWPIIYARLLRLTGQIKTLVENREDQGFNWGAHEYFLLRLTRNIPDRVICVSEAVRRVVLKREKLDPKKVIVIHNGVELAELERRGRARIRERYNFAEQHKVVGMVANFNRAVKGVEYFVQAMPQILARCPNARFLLVGHGEQEQELRDLAQKLHLGEKLVFAGYHTEIEPFYQAMDISVLTSLSEGLSITLLESMNYGLPVVVTDVGGNPEVVEDGKTGFLVSPKDVPAFVDKVCKLLEDDSLAKQFGDAGRRRIEEHFNIQKVAKDYVALYDDLTPATASAGQAASVTKGEAASLDPSA